eukprot:5718582-Amphidinium_carterae.1
MGGCISLCGSTATLPEFTGCFVLETTNTRALLRCRWEVAAHKSTPKSIVMVVAIIIADCKLYLKSHSKFGTTSLLSIAKNWVQ